LRKKLFTIIACVFTAAAGFSQASLLSEQSVLERRSTITSLPPDEAKLEAVEFARRTGLPERVVFKDGTIREIRRLSPTGRPIYNTTLNLNSARTISTNQVWEGGSTGLDLDGAGVVLGIWDGGKVRTTHVEFGGRASVLDNASELSDHGTHVAGTLGAAGINNNAHGMANKSRIDSYDWNNDISEIRSAASQGMLISNHSYGYILGFDYNNDRNRWEWWGDPEISESEDYLFGFYVEEAQDLDQIAYDHPRYLHVKSAGNDREEGSLE